MTTPLFLLEAIEFSLSVSDLSVGLIFLILFSINFSDCLFLGNSIVYDVHIRLKEILWILLNLLRIVIR